MSPPLLLLRPWPRVHLFSWRRALAPLLAAGALLLAGCATLPARGPAPESHAVADAAGSALGRLAAGLATGQAAGHSGFQLLVDPAEALQARLDLIASASHSLDLQYYIFKPDAIGHAIASALQRAAARGVRVRLLLDDLYTDAAFLRPLATAPNLEVRLFNPLPARRGGAAARLLLSLHEFRRINHRMHNKLLVADNSFSVSGGRNLGSEYFMRDADANFIDLDLLATGPAVREQSADFDGYWNSAHAHPAGPLLGPRVNAPAPAPVHGGAPAGPASTSDFAARLQLLWARAQVLADDPGKLAHASLERRLRGSVTEHTCAVIEAARSRVVLVTPYFIPGELGLGIIRGARARGVETLIITNSRSATDEPLVHAAYARYRKPMLQEGVTLYEVSATLSRRLRQFGNLGRSQGRLHTKMAMVDGRWLYVGSMNLDGRSASLNTESGLIIDSPALVQQFLRIAGPDRFAGAYEVRLTPEGRLQWLEDGGARVHDAEPGAGALDGLREWIVLHLLDEELL